MLKTDENNRPTHDEDTPRVHTGEMLGKAITANPYKFEKPISSFQKQLNLIGYVRVILGGRFLSPVLGTQILLPSIWGRAATRVCINYSI